LSAGELSDLKSKTSIDVKSSSSSNVKGYTVSVNGGFSVKLSGFAGFLGRDSADVRAASTSQAQSETKNAMSMYLVLDRSGSMSFVTDTVLSTSTKCQNYTLSNWSFYPNLSKSRPCYVNKVGALKTAAASLFDKLDEVENADPNNQLVRVGAVSFTDEMQAAAATTWGTGAARSYVTAIPAYPTGGTDMTDAMATAVAALQAPAEKSAQLAKGNDTFSKFIILMTDGENTGASSSWKPSLDAETLLTCATARNAGITIYSVAFMAPANGQAMLRSCAGASANYYEADDMATLVRAFSDIGAKAAAQSNRLVE
jgi:Mg-chelatase subunit ChlD